MVALPRLSLCQSASRVGTQPAGLLREIPVNLHQYCMKTLECHPKELRATYKEFVLLWAYNAPKHKLRGLRNKFKHLREFYHGDWQITIK